MTAATGHSKVRFDVPTATNDHRALVDETRYIVASQQFPPWLMTEPIEFPPHHSTYGWACRVKGCEALLSPVYTQLLCCEHSKQYLKIADLITIDKFIRDAEPTDAQRFGWALVRKPQCRIVGCSAETRVHGYCKAHYSLWNRDRSKGVFESDWKRSQRPLPHVERCSILGCVHDGDHIADIETHRYRYCEGHREAWRTWLTTVGAKPDRGAWKCWLSNPATTASVTPPAVRGQLSLVKLPVQLHREIRYGLHRHANTARRARWRPTALQEAIDAMARAGVDSLASPRVAELETASPAGSMERRILHNLPIAAGLDAIAQDRRTARPALARRHKPPPPMGPVHDLAASPRTAPERTPRRTG